VAFLVVAPSIQKPGDQGQIGWHQSIRNVDRYGRKDGDSTLRPGADQGCPHRPIGAVSSILSAMRGGRIQAAILTYPSIIQARREGYRELLDIASLGMPYASTGITVRRSYLQQRCDLVTNYVKAMVESIARVKKDKPFAVDVMSKYLRTTDKEILQGTYDISVTKYLKRAVADGRGVPFGCR
jgi:ABC-type nitrate/sulfonate/bicarbonate transport system substrate-binding protein